MSADGAFMVGSPEEAGVLALALATPYEMGEKDALNLQDPEGRSYDGIPSRPPSPEDLGYDVKIGTIAITQPSLNAAGNAAIYMRDESIRSIDYGTWVPATAGLSLPSNYGSEQMQSANEKMQGVADSVDMIYSGIGYAAATYHLQTVGQVNIYYSTERDTYSYQVTQNTGQASEGRGWEEVPVSQSSPLYAKVIKGMLNGAGQR